MHGALLDAEILADVYLAMTRQQDSLFVAPAAGLNHSQEPESQRRAAARRNRPPLPVIRANAEESAAHAAYLAMLDRSGGGPCVWRRLEETEAG